MICSKCKNKDQKKLFKKEESIEILKILKENIEKKKT